MLIATVAAILGLLTTATAAQADPGDEGGSASLAQKLENASKSYYETKAVLAQSRQRQAEIVVTLRESQLALARLTVEIDQIAAARYKSGQLGVISGLLASGGASGAGLQGAAVADYLVWRDNEQLRRLVEARDEAQRQQQLLDSEASLQAKAIGDLDSQKRQAEQALASVGGMITPGYTGTATEAQAAPRTANGGWPRETPTVKDPTGTGGKITPRTYHAILEAQLSGFTRHTACWRTQSWGEHPKGRACDLSAEVNGFGGVATGGDKDYGTRLAAWCVANAEALGVQYVIWFRQIWMPGIGWRGYNGAAGPSGEHTNHVHLSML